LKSDKFRHIVRKGFVRAYEKRYSTHTQEGGHHSAPCCQEEHPPTRLVHNEVALPENKQPLLSPLQPQLQSQEKILENEKQCHFEQEKEDENDPPQEEQLQVFRHNIPLAQNVIAQPPILNTIPLRLMSETTTTSTPIFVQHAIPISQPSIQNITVPQGLPSIIQNPPIIQNMTPAVECKKKLELYCQFVSDVTIEDRSMLPVNKEFTKTWRLKNSSEVPLQNCYLSFIGGEKLTIGEADSILVPGPIAARHEFDVSAHLKAPAIPGRYISYYQMTTQTGERFGHRVWVDIQVEDNDGDHFAVKQNPSLQDSDSDLTLSIKKEPTKATYGGTQSVMWSNLLAKLADMGFNDVNANMAILTKTNGDLDSTIQILLGT